MRLAKVVLVGAILLHGGLIVRGLTDPHKLFGFRPFDDFDTYSAEIVRVGSTGERRPVDDGTWAYEWNDLVDVAALHDPFSRRPTSGGADEIVDFMDRALSWLVTVTPADRETRYYEATITVYRNGGQPEVHVVRGKQRDP